MENYIQFTNETGVDFNHLKHLVGNDVMRPALQYIYLDIEKSRIVGTDALKLFWYPVHIEVNTFEEEIKGIMIDPKLFHIASYNEKIPAKWKGQITYTSTEKTSWATFGARKVYEAYNLTEGVFPQYEKVVPEEFKGEMKFIKLSKSVLTSLSRILPSGYDSLMFSIGDKPTGPTKVTAKGSNGFLIEGLFMPIQEEF